MFFANYNLFYFNIIKPNFLYITSIKDRDERTHSYLTVVGRGFYSETTQGIQDQTPCRPHCSRFSWYLLRDHLIKCSQCTWRNHRRRFPSIHLGNNGTLTGLC